MEPKFGLLLLAICIVFRGCFSCIIHQEDCPRRTSTAHPRLLFNRTQVQLCQGERLAFIKCCVDGYSSIQWSFRKSINEPWKDLYKVFSDRSTRPRRLINDTTLRFSNLYKERNNGYYKCIASDNFGNKKEIITQLYVLERGDADPTTKPTIVHSDNPTVYEEGAHVTITCKARIGVGLWGVFTWQQFNSATNKWLLLGRINASSATKTLTGINYKITVETEEPGFFITSKLIIPAIWRQQFTTYKCVATNPNGDSTERNTKLELQYGDPIKLIYAVIGVSASLGVLVCLTLVIWIFWYDVVVLAKSYVLPCLISGRSSQKEWDVAFLYEKSDDITDNYEIAKECAEYMEKHDLKCFLYDHHAIPGAVETITYCQVLDSCHLAVFLLSEDSLFSEEFQFCIETIATRKDPRRIFILNNLPQRQPLSTVLQERPQLLRHLKSEFRSVWGSCKARRWRVGFHSAKMWWGRRQFRRWMLSHMPVCVLGRSGSKRCFSRNSVTGNRY